MPRAVHETHFGLEYQCASAFGANERAGDMKSFLGQKIIQIIAGYSARDVREFLPYKIAVLVAQLL